MKIRFFSLFIILLVTASLLLTSCSSKPLSKNEPPDSEKAGTSSQADKAAYSKSSHVKAANFTLEDLDGNTISLNDLKGKNIFLNFWATWCPPCRGEMPDIQSIHEEYSEKGLVILAVNLGEGKDAIKDFVKKNNYDFKVLLDTEQTVGDMYNISAIPSSYFLDKDGNIIGKKIGAMSKEEIKSYLKLLGL